MPVHVLLPREKLKKTERPTSSLQTIPCTKMKKRKYEKRKLRRFLLPKAVSPLEKKTPK